MVGADAWRHSGASDVRNPLKNHPLTNWVPVAHFLNRPFAWGVHGCGNRHEVWRCWQTVRDEHVAPSLLQHTQRQKHLPEEPDKEAEDLKVVAVGVAQRNGEVQGDRNGAHGGQGDAQAGSDADAEIVG